jgi:hypothetical protein
MLCNFTTDSGSSSDESSDRVYLKRSCNCLESMKYKDLVPKFLISDDTASRLKCSNCRQKFKLRLILKGRACRVYIECGNEIFCDTIIMSDLDFPEHWSSFMIERL